MSFNSFQFLVFFVVVYALYRALSHRWQNRLLLLASYIFYASWDWRFLGLILTSTLVDYGCGLAIHRETRRARRRTALAVSLTVNLSILGFFKYFNFFAGELRDLLALWGWRTDFGLLHIVLPVGISFYTFQSLSYTIDIYRGRLEPTRSLPDFALFVAFFPQLVAGPIERASRLLPQIVAPRRVDRNALGEGIVLILFGCFQKVVLADNLALFVDRVFDGGIPQNSLVILLAVYAFAVQIFCDFAGYSNMARGLARCMGFDLMVNFRAPYLSRNPAEFWRRWHVSLSTWLRDYLYISLGGNRQGRWRTLRNLAVTMLLGGLWHGAAWTFVVWGAFHGVLLVLHRVFQQVCERVGSVTQPAGKALWSGIRWLACFHLVCLGWLIFRSESLAQAGAMLRALAIDHVYRFTPEIGAWGLRVMPWLAVLVLIHIAQFRHDDPLAMQRWPLSVRCVLYLFFFYSIVIFGANQAQAFIYFQF